LSEGEMESAVVVPTLMGLCPSGEGSNRTNGCAR
jgi:hypothetical protein